MGQMRQNKKKAENTPLLQKGKLKSCHSAGQTEQATKTLALLWWQLRWITAPAFQLGCRCTLWALGLAEQSAKWRGTERTFPVLCKLQLTFLPNPRSSLPSQSVPGASRAAAHTLPGCRPGFSFAFSAAAWPARGLACAPCAPRVPAAAATPLKGCPACRAHPCCTRDTQECCPGTPRNAIQHVGENASSSAATCDG